MNNLLRRSLLTAALAIAITLPAAAAPYDAQADAPADLNRALAHAGASRRTVLLVFGANWCEDCRALDASLQRPRNQALIDRSFVVVKVDVGNFDRNLALSARFGNPIKNGIPAAVVLSPAGQVLYATRAGELASARRMSETGVYDFFQAVVTRTGATPPAAPAAARPAPGSSR